MKRFLVGLAYLALVAAGLSGAAGVPFSAMFLGVIAGAALCTALALVWLTGWALRDDGRPWQFGLASLLFGTTFLGIYFGVVRWLVVRSTPSSAAQSSAELPVFLIVGVFCLLLAGFSIPFVAGMAESLVWLAVWIVRRPLVRRWLLGRRPPQGEE